MCVDNKSLAIECENFSKTFPEIFISFHSYPIHSTLVLSDIVSNKIQILVFAKVYAH
jgi:hypothetical protein